VTVQGYGSKELALLVEIPYNAHFEFSRAGHLTLARSTSTGADVHSQRRKESIMCRRLGVSFAALLFGLVAACTPEIQYRQLNAVGSKSTCTTHTDPAQCPTAEISTDPDYFLGIVEFDDQGVLFNRNQFNYVIQQIDQRTPNDQDHEGTILITFTHGWDHNAQADDENLEFFREMLSRFCAAERGEAMLDQRKPRRVIGAYLAWRGQISTWRLFQVLSFWNRKDAAHRIGERDATEVLLQLRVSAYAHPGPSRDTPNRFIVMGHSFGGALVYSAMSQLIAGHLLSRQNPASNFLPLADAVILFNPAFEAARLQHLLETAADMDEQRPGLSIFTSKTDWATGVAFPLARYVNTIGLAYREIADPVKPTEMMSQREADTHSAGHFGLFLTHDLVRAPKEGSEPCNQQQELVAPDIHALWGLRDREERSRLLRQYGDVTRHAQERLSETYADNSRSVLEFGHTCLIARGKLVRKQLAVFNVSVDSTLWDGHSLNQTEDRLELFQGFLQKFILFAASTPQGEEEVSSEALRVHPAKPRAVLREHKF